MNCLYSCLHSEPKVNKFQGHYIRSKYCNTDVSKYLKNALADEFSGQLFFECNQKSTLCFKCTEWKLGSRTSYAEALIHLRIFPFFLSRLEPQLRIYWSASKLCKGRNYHFRLHILSSRKFSDFYSKVFLAPRKFACKTISKKTQKPPLQNDMRNEWYC